MICRTSPSATWVASFAKYWKLSYVVTSGLALFIVWRMSLWLSWLTTLFSSSLSWALEALVFVVVAEVRRLGMKLRSARRQYMFGLTQENPEFIALMAAAEVSSKRYVILNPVSRLATSCTKHFSIVSKNVAQRAYKQCLPTNNGQNHCSHPKSQHAKQTCT